MSVFLYKRASSKTKKGKEKGTNAREGWRGGERVGESVTEHGTKRRKGTGRGVDRLFCRGEGALRPAVLRDPPHLVISCCSWDTLGT